MDRRRDRAVGKVPGILAVAIAVLAGTVAVQALPVLPPRALDVALGALTLAGLVACGIRGGCRPWAWCLLAMLGAFGWTAWRADLALAARLPHALEKQDLIVTGTITGLPQVRDDSTRFEFDVRRARHLLHAVPVRGRVRLAWYPEPGRPTPGLAPCEAWRLRIRMRRPRGLVNPGGLDFERTALQQDIIGTGYVHPDPGNLRLRDVACVDGLRTRIAAAIERALPPGAHAARLLRALAVGDERALDEQDWRVVRATGIAHLIAISGFHVGLAAVFATLLVRLAWRSAPTLGTWVARPIAEAAGALPAAVAYGAMAGFGLPTTRTLLMIGVVAGWRIVRRGGGFGTSFGLALVVILALDPLAVLSAGFWLSFGGVALLAWTLARAPGWRGRLREIGLAPLLMTLALLPLTVWFFGQASLVAPVANLFAVPVVSFLIVPLDLAASLLLLAWPGAGQILLQPCAWLVDAMWWLLVRLADWRPAMQYLPETSLAAFALACVGAAWLLAPRGTPARALGLLLLLPLVWPRSSAPTPGAFGATVIDVGQGLSVLVQTRGHALLFDAGARYPSGFDLGAAAVVPALHALGVTRLDRLVVSHGDNDHAGGAVAVAAAYPAARVLGGEPERGPMPMDACRAGQRWRWDGVGFTVLWPRAGSVAEGNDAGCVLLVEGGGSRLLLPADVSIHVEAALAVPPGPPLVLIAPHHGSRTSSSAALLDALQPRLAVAATGYLNGYHHPSPVVRARYAARGIPLINTADVGAVRVDFPADGPPRVIARERMRQRRYWRELEVRAGAR